MRGLETSFSSKASSCRRADLNPPLGRPGGPCHVVRRVVDQIRSPALREHLQDKVEGGQPLTNPEAARVYDRLVEKTKGLAHKIILGPHAQYRMDLREITVKDVRDALMDFSRWMSVLRKNGDPRYDEIKGRLDRGAKITYVNPKGLEIVVSFGDHGWAQLVTTFWEGVPDPKPAGDCSVFDRSAVMKNDMVRNVVARWQRRAMSWNDSLTILGFPPGSSPTDTEINAAYRQKYIDNRRLHPDTGGDPDKARDLNVARDTLMGKLSPDRGRGPVTGPPPAGYEPPPEPKRKVTTFEDAIPPIPGNVKWMFITSHASSGYSSDEFTNDVSGRVAVGDAGDKWVALAMEHVYYQAHVPGGYFSLNENLRPRDEWFITLVSAVKGNKPPQSELYGLVLKAWKTFQKLNKKWGSKVIILPEGWTPSEKASFVSGHQTTIKNYAVDNGLVSESELTVPRKVEVKLLVRRNPDFNKFDDLYSLVLNGRPHDFDEKESAFLEKSRIITAIFGRYHYPDSSKVLNRAKKGKEVMEWFLKNMPHMPEWVKKGLEAAINPPADPSKGRGYRRR